jgi:signal transduction histidine kinase
MLSNRWGLVGKTEWKCWSIWLLHQKKLDEVITDLNQILQVRHNILKEQKEKVHFSALVDDIRISIGILISEEEVIFKTSFNEVDEMFTLKSYLHSIFFNLITNSIKFRNLAATPIITIGSQTVGNKIILLFKDNGLGMDHNMQKDQVFGLYRRFYSHVEGKGMGLYMVKAQVEILGGHIYVQSEVNKSTEFRIEFDNS